MATCLTDHTREVLDKYSESNYFKDLLSKGHGLAIRHGNKDDGLDDSKIGVARYMYHYLYDRLKSQAKYQNLFLH